MTCQRYTRAQHITTPTYFTAHQSHHTGHSARSPDHAVRRVSGRRESGRRGGISWPRQPPPTVGQIGTHFSKAWETTINHVPRPGSPLKTRTIT